MGEERKDVVEIELRLKGMKRNYGRDTRSKMDSGGDRREIGRKE